MGSSVFIIWGEGEGTHVGVGEGAHFGESKGVRHVGEGPGESVHVCIGEGEWVHIRMRVYRYRYYILYCSLQFE